MADNPKRRGPPQTFNVQKCIDDLRAYISKSGLPFIEDFLTIYDYSNTTFYRYAKDNEELRETIKKTKDKAISCLFKGGLSKKFHPAVCIFGLKNLGWRDDQADNHLIFNAEKQTITIAGKEIVF
jgi:hypothetical protein